MGDHESTPFDLEPMIKTTLSLQETNILKIVASKYANEAAHHIDSRCPPLTEQKEASSYVWALWEVVVMVARNPNVTGEIHAHFVKILQGLGQISKGEMVL